MAEAIKPQNLNDVRYKYKLEEKELIKKKEADLEALKELFKKEKLETQKSQADTIGELRTKGQIEKLDTIEDLENQLKATRNQISATQQKLVKNSQLEQQTFENNLDNLRHLHADKISNIAQKNRFELEDLNNEADRKTQDITSQLNTNIFLANQQAAQKVGDIKITQDNLLSSKQRDFELAINQKQNQFLEAMASQDIEHENLVKEKEKKHKDHLKELDKKFQSEVNFWRAKYRDALIQAKERFDAQLQAKTKAHTDSLSTLKTLSEKEINDVKLSNQKTKGVINNKQNDKFYHMIELKPTIKQNEKDYSISLPVPEHERDQVKLNVYRRELTLHLARKFEGKTNAPDGSSFKTNRAETISKKFNVPHILNPEGVKSKYEDGVLTFVVSKL